MMKATENIRLGSIVKVRSRQYLGEEITPCKLDNLVRLSCLWEEEMENRFGLRFLIFDRDFLSEPGPARGYLVKPWQTHTRFIISPAILRDENYADPKFEHELFLSATPHNGHSNNSFAALLEMLDPQRFCRRVPVKNTKLLDDVMVWRLKKDLRLIGDDFPERQVISIVMDNLPDEAPE